MRIKDLLADGHNFVSLEFFPPKDLKAWPEFFSVVGRLKAANPLFVSVTYGAGGSTQSNTLEIVSRLKKEYGLEPMAHLTCIGADLSTLESYLESLRQAGVNNVLALRGDPPRDKPGYSPEGQAFRYASELVAFIRERFPEMGIGVAAYPETHPEAVSPEADLDHLKRKLDAGADFAITQLFFDNDVYFRFVERAKAIGIDKPIIPGILPIMNLKSVMRILSLCGAKLPEEYARALELADKYGGSEALIELGVRYAARQAADLLERGAPGVHLYTLNKAEPCLKIAGSLG